MAKPTGIKYTFVKYSRESQLPTDYVPFAPVSARLGDPHINDHDFTLDEAAFKGGQPPHAGQRVQLRTSGGGPLTTTRDGEEVSGDLTITAVTSIISADKGFQGYLVYSEATRDSSSSSAGG